MSKTPLEFWAGLECTINRIGENYFSQFDWNRHTERNEDLELLASLGVKKIRYPVLWEAVAPAHLDELDFKQPDFALNELKRLGVEPIAGLLHHGSGPRYTSLIDPQFPEKLTEYAIRVAERYPWINYYTPVNEPLTTARFSALYGHWYPHRRDDRAFLTALINQVKGTCLAMKAIRKINPNAKLVQTEDIGKTTSTPDLKYQADFENQRRWLSFDLLFGRVTHEHPLFGWLVENGVLIADLDQLRDEPCPPDLLGVNHYPLSNRFLDSRLNLYPACYHGGNCRDNYADVGAVDSGQAQPPPPIEILREVWERFHSPFAVTEVHIGGGREAQMRWLYEIVESANILRDEGAGLRAVTLWSAMGSHDWNSLCTRCDGHYEPGAFDVRCGRPRPTALARMITDYVSTGNTSHPLLKRRGYWHEPMRVRFAPGNLADFSYTPPSRPVIITDSTTELGRAFVSACERRGIDIVTVQPDYFELKSARNLRSLCDQVNPWAVIDTHASGRLRDLSYFEGLTLLETIVGSETWADICASKGLQFLTFSTEQDLFEILHDMLMVKLEIRDDELDPASAGHIAWECLDLLADGARDMAIFYPGRKYPILPAFTRESRTVSA